MFNDWLQVLVFMVVLLTMAVPFGSYMAKVLKGEKCQLKIAQFFQYIYVQFFLFISSI